MRFLCPGYRVLRKQSVMPQDETVSCRPRPLAAFCLDDMLDATSSLGIKNHKHSDQNGGNHG
jgi:hypothetical protein